MCNKLVSVIIPTHKGAEKICRAVDSVLIQTYPNIEIIVVDDNGIDTDEHKKTDLVMQKYKDNEKVQYIVHEKNKNGSAARNTGIRASHGDYIAFLDDDDVFLKDKIKKQVALFESLSDEWGLVYCSFQLDREDMPSQMITATQKGDVLFEYLAGKIEIASSLIMFRRKVLDDVIEFDESFYRHQDLEFIARIASKYKVDCVSDVLAVKNLVRRNSAKNAEQFEKFRLHYLDKMKSVIDTLSQEQKLVVYNYHYRDMGKAYFKNKKFLKSISFARKTSQPMGTICSYFTAGASYLKKILSNRQVPKL